MRRRSKSFLKWLLIALDRLFIKRVKQKKGVVVIRLDAIGDFVIWSHCADRYRQLFPQLRILLIGNKVWTEVAEYLPYWDEVWSVDFRRYQKNLFYRWKILRKVSKAGFEVAIQPTHSRNILHGDSIIRATCANKRIGSRGDLSNVSEWGKMIADKWYTYLVPVSSDNVTELERNTEFMNHLTGLTFLPKIYALPVLQNLPDKFLLQREYMIIFPGASWQGRKWPPESFATLITQIAHKYGWFPVLCGSQNERDLCETIAQLAQIDCLNLAGQTNLPEFIELTRRAKLVVGNETSAIHIAVAVKTPSICITGGGHFGRFVPYPKTVNGIKPLVVFENMQCFRCNWQCSQNYDGIGAVPCIQKIRVQPVLDMVTKIGQSVTLSD